MPVRTLAIVIGTVLTLSACSSSKDASEANFAKAIDAYYGANCTVLDFSMGATLHANFSDDGFPASVADAATLGGNPEDRPAASFEALEKAGLLSSKVKEVPASMFGKMVPGREYALTDAGTKALAKPGGHSFCVGHRKVDKIVQFTKPSDAMGQTMSQATYTYTVADVPAWARNPAVQAAFPEVVDRLKPMRESRVDLVLMNDGWDAQPSPF